MNTNTFTAIEKAITKIMQDIENFIEEEELSEVMYEGEVYIADSQVKDAEVAYINNPSEENGRILDLAYDAHEEVIDNYNAAVEKVQSLYKILDLLEKATWEC